MQWASEIGLAGQSLPYGHGPFCPPEILLLATARVTPPGCFFPTISPFLEMDPFGPICCLFDNPHYFGPTSYAATSTPLKAFLCTLPLRW